MIYRFYVTPPFKGGVNSPIIEQATGIRCGSYFFSFSDIFKSESDINKGLFLNCEEFILHYFSHFRLLEVTCSDEFVFGFLFEFLAKNDKIFLGNPPLESLPGYCSCS